MESERALTLKVHIKRLQDEYDDMKEDLILSTEDWHNIALYVRSVKTLADASRILEGRDFPTASSVIPFLDQVNLISQLLEDYQVPMQYLKVSAELMSLNSELPEQDRVFPSALLNSFQGPRRFPNGYTDIMPFNCLTLLDPRSALFFKARLTLKSSF